MAQPSTRANQAPARAGDPRAERLPAQGTNGQTPAPQQVRKHAVGHVVVLEATGLLGDVVEELDRCIQLALADGPRGVVADLSGVLEGAEPGALAMLATSGRHVRDWPGTPVAVASPDPQLRGALNDDPVGGHLIVATSVLSAVSAVRRVPTPKVEWLRLAPHPTAPRASRNFVTRTLLGWQLSRVIPGACLVVSELVTNSTIHAGTALDLSLAWNLAVLRLTVRDNGPWVPHQRRQGLETNGRGLTIVGGLSREFGVLPTADGGKVVWAVINAPETLVGQPTPY